MAHAQQPSTESNAPVKQRTEASTASSMAPPQLVIQSNGAPVPFATVLNTNTGQAAVANAQGQVLLSVWGAHDTLRIQSMGYEMLTVVPGVQTMLNVELVPTTFEIEEVVVQSNAEVSGALTMASVSHLDRMAVKAPVVTVETTGDLLQNSGQVHLQMSQQGGISPSYAALRPIACCWWLTAAHEQRHLSFWPPPKCRNFGSVCHRTNAGGHGSEQRDVWQ